jgi:ABC-type transporter Mla MlaB component
MATTSIVFTVRGPLERADLPGLCDRVCALLASRAPQVVFCELEDVRADAVTADALARLQLALRRCGCELRLCHASPELAELIAYMGLRQALPEDATSQGAEEGRTAGTAARCPGRT